MRRFAVWAMHIGAAERCNDNGVHAHRVLL